MHKKKVSGIIQVRLGSKRLKKKSLASIGNYKILDWVIKRTKRSSLLDDVILATTNKPEDRIFKKFAKKYKIKIFFGSEKNVLKRYCDVARKYSIKNIVRVCADNPLISPDFINKLISFYRKNKCDLAFNHISKKKYNFKCIDGLGAEIFSAKILDKIRSKTKNKKNLEHVTKYFYEKKLFKIKPVPVKKIYTLSKISLDVDTKKDLVFLNSLIKDNNINIYSKSEKIARSVTNVKN
jgi:spore coat polysaccharide biosynthesis protein SpsF